MPKQEIRVTRPLYSTDPDRTARQGEYIYGDEEATFQTMLLRALDKFPGEPLDVESEDQYMGRFMAKHHGTPDQMIIKLPLDEPGVSKDTAGYALDVFTSYCNTKETSLGVDLALARLAKALGRRLDYEQVELLERNG